MGDDITIGVTEIVNNIEVTAQPNDQIVDISVTDNADNVTLNITPTVIEVNVNKGSSFAKWGDIYGTLSDQTDLQNALNLKANLVGGKVPASELPSYVDDIIEVANYAALPTTGEIGKIYVTLDNNKIYRWSGSVYIEIASNSAIWGAITGTLSSQTDLVNALNLRVPYTGATSNVNLGEYGLTSGFLGLDTTPTSTPTGIGTIYWDAANRTAALIDGDGDTTLQIGQEQRILVHNNTGSTLTDGQVVYVTGSTGNVPSVSLANASSETTSAATIGVVTESIAQGADGFITTSGIVNGLNTLAFNEGDLLWLGTTAGTFTTTKPISPNHLVLIGYVIKKAGGNGSILVKIQNTQELEESSDVLFTSLTNKDFLVYESATDLWKNKSLGTVLGGTSSQFVKGDGSLDSTTYQPLLTNPVTGTGLQNFVTKWTGIGSAITESKIYDNGTNVGIGSINPSSLLELEKNNATGGGFLNIINTNSAMTGKIADINFKIGDSFGIPVDAAYIQAIPANANVSTGASLSFFTRKGNADPTASFTINNVGAVTINNLAGTGSRMVIANSTGQLSTQAITLGTVTSVSALTIGTTGTDITSTVANETTTPVITLNVPTASASNRGALSAADWTTFNSKQSALSGTGFVKITGSTISYDNSTYVPTSRTLTINGTAYDLSADRSWTISAGVTGTGTTNYIPKFTGASAIGNSLIYDNGTNVGIGTTSAGVRFVNSGATLAPTPTLGSGTIGANAILSANGLYGLYTGVSNTGDVWQQVQRNDANSAVYNLLLQPLGGNVGIGTTSPSYILQTKAGSGFVGAAFSSSYAATSIIGNDANSSWFGQGTNGLGSAYVINNTSGYAQIELGGSPRFYVNSSGNVGIGTTSPGQKLDVNGNANITGYATIGGSAYLASGNSLYFDSGVTNDYGIRKTGSSLMLTTGGNFSMLGGNVGIGTTSPAAKLSISYSSATADALNIVNTNTNGRSWYVGDGAGLGAGNFGFYDATAGASRLVISSGGNVGIGTTSPAYKFDLNSNAGGISFKTYTSTTNNSEHTYSKDAGFFIDSYQSVGGAPYTKTTDLIANADAGADSQLRMFTATTGGNPTERMRITSGGNILIGTTSDAGQNLQVNGNAIIGTSSTTSQFRFYRSTNVAGLEIQGGSGSASVGGSAYLRLGDVTNSRYWMQQINNSYNLAYWFFDGGSWSNPITFTNNGSASFAGSITASGGFFNSDMRLKDLTDYDYNVSDIKPITYLWKDGRDNKKHVGYSAQEVQKVMPDAVNEDANGMLSVNYVEILVAKISQMEKEIAYLKSKI